MKYMGSTEDFRSETTILYFQASIDEYLEYIGNDFDKFEIQRKKENFPIYTRMKEDIKKGCLLPTITLAVKMDKVEHILELLKGNKFKDIEQEVRTPDIVSILDGLQRTHILKDIKKEGFVFNPEQKLLLEYWLEKDINNLVYRLIVLNAGQKRMSMRHQIELLFSTIREKIHQQFPNLELLTEREVKRRTKANKIAFDTMVLGYQAFLLKTSELDKENIIAQKLNEDSVLDSSEEQIQEQFQQFLKYLAYYLDLDKETYRIYSVDSKKDWMVEDTVVVSFFASISSFCSNDDRQRRTEKALSKLVANLKSANTGDDPLGLISYDLIKKGIDPRKSNIGYATRKVIVNAFKEYYRDEGETLMSSFWISEA